MRFGLFQTIQWPAGTGQPDRYRQGIDEVLLAEDLGFDSVWLTEHHFSRHGLISDNLALLAYLAARTTTIRLGTAVLVLPIRDPLRVAETAATIDVLSHGRLDLGIGHGYQRSEFDGFNVPLEDRKERFREARDVILQAWSPEPFTHRGQYWIYNEVDAQPKPVQRPHPPLWVATDSLEGMTECVENGWGILLPQGRPFDAVAGQVERFVAASRSLGREPDFERIILARALYVAATDQAAWDEVAGPYRDFLNLASALAAKPQPVGPSVTANNPFQGDPKMENSVVFGSPDSCIATLRKFEALGLRRIIGFVHIGGLPAAQIEASMRLFAREVMPQLARV
jgi:alkanesulfonate monooxygenase SsuD/methylene tetrahydromethanopterin reductase-like flavin-dependent oxidoreductase (luciferase family)